MAAYTVAGVSRNDGKVKVRFCSDMVLRIKNLQKQGDTDIQLIELPRPMDKVEICNFLLQHPSFQSYVTEIGEILGKKMPGKAVIASKVAVQKPEVDSELEEIKELAAA